MVSTMQKALVLHNLDDEIEATINMDATDYLPTGIPSQYHVKGTVVGISDPVWHSDDL